ncbi:MAG TPA: hypothetical protein VGH79_03985 [Gaiellaceae bacterium]|jgi:hypothetical protein
MSETDPETGDEPTFEEVSPDLDVAGQLLTALGNDDEEAISALRESDADWWNVAWTFALLIRGLQAGEPAAVGLVTALLGDDSTAPTE